VAYEPGWQVTYFREAAKAADLHAAHHDGRAKELLRARGDFEAIAQAQGSVAVWKHAAKGYRAKAAQWLRKAVEQGEADWEDFGEEV
jgi:hypothetical protein